MQQIIYSVVCKYTHVITTRKVWKNAGYRKHK